VKPILGGHHLSPTANILELQHELQILCCTFKSNKETHQATSLQTKLVIGLSLLISTPPKAPPKNINKTREG
jgi:hypothetical protein